MQFLINWLTKYSLNPCSVPATLLGPENILVKKRKSLSSWNLYSIRVLHLDCSFKVLSHPSSHVTFGKTLRTRWSRYWSYHFSDEETHLDSPLSIRQDPGRPGLSEPCHGRWSKRGWVCEGVCSPGDSRALKREVPELSWLWIQPALEHLHSCSCVTFPLASHQLRGI